jgi:hypothetical protein
MSNHWHLCLTDSEGAIVDFQRDCHAFIARALNASDGEIESLWASPQQGSRVECEEASDLIEKMVYTLANPVEAGLVAHGKSWPGVRHAWPMASRTVRRPKRFFRGEERRGKWPEVATLTMARPPGYGELSDEALADLIRRLVCEREERFRRLYRARRRPFLGRRGVLAQSNKACARTGPELFSLNPKVACKDKWRRIERLAANRAWLDCYHRALSCWRAGDKSATFPLGTYKMRVLHGVRVDAAVPT